VAGQRRLALICARAGVDGLTCLGAGTHRSLEGLRIMVAVGVCGSCRCGSSRRHTRQQLRVPDGCRKRQLGGLHFGASAGPEGQRLRGRKAITGSGWRARSSLPPPFCLSEWVLQNPVQRASLEGRSFWGYSLDT